MVGNNGISNFGTAASESTKELSEQISSGSGLQAKIKSRLETAEIVKNLLEGCGMPYTADGSTITVDTIRPCRMRQTIRIYSDSVVVLTSRKLQSMPTAEFINIINSKCEIGTYYTLNEEIVYSCYAFTDGQIEDKILMILANGKRKSMEFSFVDSARGPIYG